MRDLEQYKDFSPGRLFSLEGEVALVTGAAGGIGSWLAGGLAAAGADVILTDTNASGLDRVKSILEGDTAVTTITADLSDPYDREKLVERAASWAGRLDILVNCAGINIRMPTLSVQREEYRRIMDVNLEAPFFLTQAVVPHMLVHGGGSVIHVGSINGFQGLPEVGVYGPAKAALQQLTQVQAIEWPLIRVNCIAPGFMDTPLTEPLQADPARSSWIMSRVPQRRFGDPSELVGAVQLLASRAGSFITGQTFYIDGGFTAGSDWRMGGPGFSAATP